MFYFPIMPLGLPIAMVGNFLCYFVHKWSVLKVIKRPTQVGPILPIFVLNMIPFFVLTQCISFLVFYRTLAEEFKDILQT